MNSTSEDITGDQQGTAAPHPPLRRRKNIRSDDENNLGPNQEDFQNGSQRLGFLFQDTVEI